MRHIGEIEVQMKSEMVKSSMAQFVSFVDLLHLREGAFTVSYPVQLIPMLIRSSMCTFVSMD